MTVGTSDILLAVDGTRCEWRHPIEELVERSDTHLAPLAAKLASWLEFSDDDLKHVLSLPHELRVLPLGEFIIRDGEAPRHSYFVLSGFAARHKVLGKGRRQLLSLHVRGDLIDLHNAVLGRADHHVQTLSETWVAEIPVEAIQRLAAERPNIRQALWSETLVDAAIFRQWALNAGQRDGRERMAHLLCEFQARLELAGLIKEWGFKLPMTQEQMAEALAMTNVHVSRVLKQLTDDGLIERPMFPYIRIVEPERLATIAGFNPGYLHHRRRIDPGAS